MAGRSASAAAVIAAVVLLVAGADSAAACGYHRHARAHRGPRDGRAPLVIGDSTMIYATPRLGRLGIEADAMECRQFTDGVDMLAARRGAGTLPRLAILALGANGPVDDASVRRALAVMGPDRVLGLVTPRNLAQSAREMRHAARAHPLRVLLIDWVARSAAHDEWFAGDGLHVNFPGARAYADLIRATAAPLIDLPPASLHIPADSTGAKPCGTVQRFGRHLDVYVLHGATHVTCGWARTLARRPPLRHHAKWDVYDRPGTGKPPWQDLYVRTDRRVIVGLLDTPDS
jgi:hypothetical protein